MSERASPQARESRVLEAKPWRTEHASVANRPWGMLFAHEASLLYYLARDWYCGHGELIDAGAFLGASSYCLGKGLSENTRIPTKSGRIHAFDQFEMWSELGGTREQMADAIQKGFHVAVRPGETFLHLYTRNVFDYCRYIQIHNGDFLDTEWQGRPIELLFVDICKTPEIMRHIVSTMYRSLIPGHSIIVHQDYHHSLLPWIHVAQERLAEYFEVVEEIADTSIALRLLDIIPDWVLDEVVSFDYSPAEQLALMDSAVARVAEEHRSHVKLARAVLLLRLGRRQGAEAAYAEFAESADPHDHILRNNLEAAVWAYRHWRR